MDASSAGDIGFYFESAEDDLAWQLSSAKWIERANWPGTDNRAEMIMYAWPAPSGRWNGVLYAGHLHVSDVLGCLSVEEVASAALTRGYKPVSVKTFEDMEKLRSELHRLGKTIQFN